MRLGAALAVICNNDGFNGILNMLDTMFITVPVRAKEGCRIHDNATIRPSERTKRAKKKQVENRKA